MLQSSPAAHAMSHPPQCALLAWVSTQASPQRVAVLPPQLRPQVPMLQSSPAAQAMSQPPQWALLVWVSTHASPQSVAVLPEHTVPHVPSLQTSPSAHAVPPSQVVGSAPQ